MFYFKLSKVDLKKSECDEDSINLISSGTLNNGVVKRIDETGDSKSEACPNVAKYAYDDLDKHNELFTILDELPEELTLNNAINVLQELAQKGYISMLEYNIPNDQEYDNDGNPSWTCSCYIRSCFVKETAYATSKKVAKKYAAYLCICRIKR